MNKINVYDDSTTAGMYMDWYHNFLTVPRFAEHYGISIPLANQIIERGRIILERQHNSELTRIRVTT